MSLKDVETQIASSILCLEQIIANEKPVLSQSNWLYAQIQLMCEAHILSDVVTSYITLPSEQSDRDQARKLKGEIPIISISERLLNQQEALRKRLNKKIDEETTIIDLEKDDDYINPSILSFTGIYGLLNFLKELQNRIQNPHSEYQPLIIFNEPKRRYPDGIWQNLLQALNIEDSEDSDFWTSLNIRIANSEDTVFRFIEEHKKELPKIQNLTANFNRIRETSVGNASIISASQNRLKNLEFRNILDLFGVSFSTVPFTAMVGKHPQAKETAGTLEGNLVEKIMAASEHLKTIYNGEHPIYQWDYTLQRMRACGVDPDNCFILFEDTGISFKNMAIWDYELIEDFMNIPEMKAMRDAGKPLMGPEMANLAKATSRDQMFEIFTRYFERHPEADRSMFQMSIVALVPFRQLIAEDPLVGMHIVNGVSEGRFLLSPKPDDVRHQQWEHRITNSKNSTDSIAELPSYKTIESGRARALRASLWMNGLIESLSMPKFGMNLEFLKRAQLVSNDNIRVARYADVIEPQHDVVDACPIDVNVIDKKSGDSVQCTIDSRLSNFVQLCSDFDAFYMDQLPHSLKDEGALRALYLATGFVVGKQIYDPMSEPKPVVFDKESWEPLLDIIHNLHESSMLLDEPEILFREIKTAAEAATYINNRLSGYEAKEVIKPFIEYDGAVCPKELFVVTIYCSASTKNPQILSETEQFGYQLARRGFAIRFGGGDDGAMGALMRGVARYADEAKHLPYKSLYHVTTIPCIDTRATEGLVTTGDQCITTSNIELREEKLDDNEAAIFLAGGTGTVKEMFLPLLRKIQNPENMRPVIFHNFQMKINGQADGIFSKVLSYLSKTTRLLNRPDVLVETDFNKILESLECARLKAGKCAYQIKQTDYKPRLEGHHNFD